MRNAFLRNAKYELMVYLVEHGVQDISTLITIKPDETAEKFKGANKEILDILTKYVKASKKRIANKGYFFPGVAAHEHTSKVATINGLRKYLANGQSGKTFESIGLVTSSREKRLVINNSDDALAFLESVQK